VNHLGRHPVVAAALPLDAAAMALFLAAHGVFSMTAERPPSRCSSLASETI
jgi:hypothetical protein